MQIYKNSIFYFFLRFRFDLKNLTANQLLLVILRNGKNYEVPRPLKNVRENKVYTVKEDNLEKITCDDNGAYLNSRNVKTHYLVEELDGTLRAKKVHKSDDGHFINKRQGQGYVAVPVGDESVYLIERYFRQGKSIPNLQRMIVRVKRVIDDKFEAYVCVVYHLDGDVKEAVEVELLEHGNSKPSTTRPYIRTRKSVLERQDVYDILLEESGGPFSSASSSSAPRNVKQIQNRKHISNISSTERDDDGNDELLKLVLAQRNSESLIKTVIITGKHYLTFAYNEKQIQDIEKFCTTELEASVLAVDTTFNLCDMWITDTSYRNKRLLNPTTGKHTVFLFPVMLHFSKNEKTFGRIALELVSANPKLKHLKKIGVDLESAIFNGFSNIIPTVSRLVCVHQLKKRDELKLLNLLGKTRKSAAKRNHAKGEIVKDICGSREGNYYEYGIAEATDAENFTAELESLQSR